MTAENGLLVLGWVITVCFSIALISLTIFVSVLLLKDTIQFIKDIRKKN